MQIANNNYSIAEINEMVALRKLIVNEKYQRGPGIWPSGPRGFFIDTILQGYPFPKIYFFEYIDKVRREIVRELVDGQQRVTAIVDFIANKFAVSGDSPYAGKRFRDLENEEQLSFLSYSVSADVIRNADPARILQMFRRMNAYTLPLNEAEKRHSTFQGAFKWEVNTISERLNPFFTEFGVFTSRQIIRMADAELIADIVLAFEEGVVSTSPKMLSDLYEKYDQEFANAGEFRNILLRTFDFITVNFPRLRGTFMMKPYAVHTLVLALAYNKFGFGALSEIGDSIGEFCRDSEVAQQRLLELASSHETKDIDGPHGDYVKACSGGTNRQPSRLTRLRSMHWALVAA